jgi:N-acetylglucosaminyldiphosphoundecaprenol N-acetyl-beta-D-mannosaminyltransferase
VFFFGGKPAILDQALTRVREMHPGLRIVGSAAPRIDLDVCSPEERAALASIRETKPDLLLLFLGAPKQEKWFWRRAPELPPTVALAAGGTVDLIAGAKHRAPRLVQSAGCEWLWRMSQEPKRLGKRYLVHDSLFLRIATTQLRERYARQPAIRDDARP